MLRGEEFLDIRAMWQRGMNISDIARATGRDRKTIRKVVHAQEVPRYRRAPVPSKLDPHKEYIMERLADGVFNCVVLLREIKAQGYYGGISILKDFVRPHRAEKVHATMRYETKPGEQAQVDWGYLGRFEIDGQMRNVYVFAVVLGYSRYMYAECTLSMDEETLLRCHVNALQAFGGRPRKFLYDRMKTVILKSEKSGEKRWNRRFLDFAHFYDIQPTVCEPYRPQTKGKIENGVKYIKGNFCCGRSFTDLDDLNRQLQAWLAEANRRVHGTTHEVPAERLAGEQLRPLAGPDFVTDPHAERKVSRDCLVSYNGVLYSVPWQHSGRRVQVREMGRHIAIHSAAGELLAEHQRPGAGQRQVIDKRHWHGIQSSGLDRRPPGLRLVPPDVQRPSLADYEALAWGEVAVCSESSY